MTLRFGFRFLAATAALRPAPPDPMIKISQDGNPEVLESFSIWLLAAAFVAPFASDNAPIPIQAVCRNSLLLSFSFIRDPLY